MFGCYPLFTGISQSRKRKKNCHFPLSKPLIMLLPQDIKGLRSQEENNINETNQLVKYKGYNGVGWGRLRYRKRLLLWNKQKQVDSKYSCVVINPAQYTNTESNTISFKILFLPP
jgi:hypothetical protein